MTLYSTLWQEEPSTFSEGLVELRRDRQSWRSTARTLWGCQDGDAVLLNGAIGYDGRYVDLFLGLLIRLRRRRVALVISDATWHARSTVPEARVPALHGVVELFGKLLLRLLRSPDVHFCFLSEEETRGFAAEAGVDPRNVHFTPYFPSILVQELPGLQAIAAAARCSGAAPYVFSGGNSSRDYQLLVDALGGAPYQVRVACKARLDWPSNFVVGPVGHREFLELLAASAVVVLPLVTETPRGVGQQTYLNALLLGVPVVINEAVGVREYLENEVDALVVQRDAGQMRAAVDRLLDPANRGTVDALVERGRQKAETLRRDVYFLRLKALLREAQGRLQARQ